MTERALARCGRTAAIVGAVLDGTETPLDRSHIATCPICRRESERASRFDRSLAAAAAEVSDAIPDPAALAGERFVGPRIGRLGLGMARITTLAAAVLVGLLVANLIGSRVQPPTGQSPSPFSTAEEAREALAPLGIVCQGLVCEATLPNHVHRVLLTENDGRVVGVEARIDSTDGNVLDLRGVDDFYARIAAAVLSPDVETAAASWLRAEYATCGAGCAVELEQVDIAVEVGSRSVSLTLREP